MSKGLDCCQSVDFLPCAQLCLSVLRVPGLCSGPEMEVKWIHTTKVFRLLSACDGF